MSEFKCVNCHKLYPLSTLEYRCECGGLFKFSSSAKKFSLDLIDKDEFSIFRYREFMGIDTANFREVSMGEGLTKSVKFSKNLYLKLDYAMPTLSFKDRGAAVLMSHIKNLGVKNVIQDSSGNAGNSIAAYAARCGVECEIYVPKGTSEKKIDMIKSHGARVVVCDATRDETANIARKRAVDEKIYYANHVFNPIFYEGTKTYIYEIFEDLKRVPENIFIPVGNGTLLLGSIIALNELKDSGYLKNLPTIFIIQSQNCPPLFYKDKVIAPKPTLAEGIAIGKPARKDEILSLSKEYQGEIKTILAPEDGILEARSKLARGGFYVEHTTAATFAAYKEYLRFSSLDGDSIIPLCGAGLKSDH